MSCDGDCKCGEKENTTKKEFDRLAELKKFIPEDLEIDAIDYTANAVILQFCGWAIKLYDDGVWIVTDTSGG